MRNPSVALHNSPLPTSFLLVCLAHPRGSRQPSAARPHPRQARHHSFGLSKWFRGPTYCSEICSLFPHEAVTPEGQERSSLVSARPRRVSKPGIHGEPRAQQSKAGGQAANLGGWWFAENPAEPARAYPPPSRRRQHCSYAPRGQEKTGSARRTHVARGQLREL